MCSTMLSPDARQENETQLSVSLVITITMVRKQYSTRIAELWCKVSQVYWVHFWLKDLELTMSLLRFGLTWKHLIGKRSESILLEKGHVVEERNKMLNNISLALSIRKGSTGTIVFIISVCYLTYYLTKHNFYFLTSTRQSVYKMNSRSKTSLPLILQVSCFKGNRLAFFLNQHIHFTLFYCRSGFSSHISRHCISF